MDLETDPWPQTEALVSGGVPFWHCLQLKVPLARLLWCLCAPDSWQFNIAYSNVAVSSVRRAVEARSRVQAACLWREPWVSGSARCGGSVRRTSATDAGRQGDVCVTVCCSNSPAVSDPTGAAAGGLKGHSAALRHLQLSFGALMEGDEHRGQPTHC
jgi:hypothetical protein